jgi:hypothetical protein
MKSFSYRGNIITANSKQEAIQRIIASTTLTLYKLIKEKPFKKDYTISGKFGKGAYFYDNANMLKSENSRKVYGDIGVRVVVEVDECLDLTQDIEKAVELMIKKGCSASVIKIANSLIGLDKIPFPKIQLIGTHYDDMKKFECVRYKSPQCSEGYEVVIFDTNKIKTWEYIHNI